MIYFYSGIYAKIFSFLMSIVFFFNGFSFKGINFEKAVMEYDYANSVRGSAAGTVSVSAAIDGKYTLYWGDSDENRLSFNLGERSVPYSEFAEVTVKDGEGSVDIQSFTAIPEGAETVLVCRGPSIITSEDIPDEKVTDNGDELYRFGALSDVHFNRYMLSLGDDSCITFSNALNFFDDCSIQLVALSGDLSNKGEEDSFRKFNYYTSQHDYPVYTCTGNHDVHDEGDISKWQDYINTGVYSEKKREGVVTVADNNMDFVYSPKGVKGDVFIFLSQYAWDYNSDKSRILTDSQLEWLGTQLEKYKDTTVYLFFHTFLNNLENDGNKYMGEGNFINPGGEHYNLSFTSGCADEVKFREYLKTYKNVIYFNGHSHWAYDMQKYNSAMNITDYNGEYATMVHISSVSAPRVVLRDDSEDTTDCNLLRSEGMLVTVYEDRIVISGIDFNGGRMLAYATYNIELD